MGAGLGFAVAEDALSLRLQLIAGGDDVLHFVRDVVNPAGGVLVAGNYTFDQTGPKERHDYDLILSSDTASVTATPRRITASKIRGDATLTPAGIELHGVEAEVLGGKLKASGTFKTSTGDNPDTYAGDVVITDMDLAKLEPYLLSHVPGAKGPLSVEQFPGGASNLTYQILSGPGSISAPPGSWADITGLSTTAETRIRVTRRVTSTALSPEPRAGRQTSTIRCGPVGLADQRTVPAGGGLCRGRC